MDRETRIGNRARSSTPRTDDAPVRAEVLPHGNAAASALAHTIVLEPIGVTPLRPRNKIRLAQVLVAVSACLLIVFATLHQLGWTSAPVLLHRTLVVPTAPAAPPR